MAPALLGCRLAHGGVEVRVTEVEVAYAGEDDPASHAWRGRTPRTEVMFGEAGRAYLYFTYGVHWCLNVVTGVPGTASAVLVRAGEVVAGEDVVAGRRPGVPRRDWARGPGRVCRALALGREEYGADLLDPASPLRLLPPTAPVDADRVRSGPRVGVSRAADRPWRFWLDGEPSVSAYKRGTRASRAAGGPLGDSAP